MSNITAYKCAACGQVMYPKHTRCLNCNEREFTEFSPSGKAKLITYTIVNELPWGIDERGRILGVVVFEDGVKALGLIKSDKPKIGMVLEPDWDVVRVIGGERVYGLVFE